MKLFMISMLFISMFSNAKEVRTEIGKWETYSGSIRFYINEKDDVKSAYIYTTDEHVISSNMYNVNVVQLKQIRSLINETIVEMESSPNNRIKQD
jgi:hypothetical protein